MTSEDVHNSGVYKVLSEEYTVKCQSSNSNIKRIDLDLTPVGFGDQIAYILENVFTPEECQEMIDDSEELGYEQAVINDGGRAILSKGYRDSKRILVDDVEFSKILFTRIGKLLPQTFELQYDLLEINERLRFLRYDPGDFFKEHYDGQYTRPDNSASTYFTLQIYLNEEMDGGETTFLHWEDGQELRESFKVTPKTGMILVFDHDILHEGSLVTDGQKYTIRMDVLYKSSSPH